MLNRLIASAAVALFGAIVMAGAVFATAQSGVTSTTLATGVLDPINVNVHSGDWKARLKTDGESSVTVVQNTVIPGGSFGWHSHPGPSLIVVKSGTLTFYDGDDPTCSPERYSAGQAVLDSGDHVHIARNEGTVDAVVIVTRLLPPGASPRIDQPDPGNCSF